MKYRKTVYQALATVSQFGINMLVPIFLCSFLGIFLDQKLGTNFLVIILFFVGAVAGGYNVYRFSRQIFAKDSEQSAYLHKSRRDKGDLNERKDHQNKQDAL